MSALFNFESLLLVILLLICTSTYLHSQIPAIMDRNKHGLVPFRVYNNCLECLEFSGNSQELERG
jgi:hypothetical protein